MAHFRLLTDTNFLPYGRSAIEAARRTWKSLTIMTDAMMIYRIMRAPERRLFKVDVLGMPPEDVVTYMNDIASKMKKTPYRNPLNG
ncbi:MAG TPA: portal protein [Bacteroidales bacterium]|nr:portal protein [Bacteroidales bacterium]HQL12006.1 portal protein [bacterium]HRR51923.1 portal protein [Bacteroidales bacterium]